MRRRQATIGADNGIFILGPPGASAGEKGKYDRRQKSTNLWSALMAVGVFVIAGYLVLSNNVLKKQQQPAESSDSVAGKEEPISPKSSLRIPDPPAANRNDKKGAIPPPPKRPAFDPPIKIPRRLIFTYKYNLIAPAMNAPPMKPQDPLTANVLHTIDKYQKQWDDMDAKMGVSRQKREKVVVSFLSDEGCVEVIRKTEPRLVDHFNSEKRGEFKADICRVAELYLYGGFYFDIDIGVVEPLHDFDGFYLPTDKNNDAIFHLQQMSRNALHVPSNDDIVTFASIFNGQGRFFQAFTAATPKHVVLKRALEYMYGYYEGTLESMLPKFMIEDIKSRNKDSKTKKGYIPTRKHPTGMGAGPFTLSIAHRATTDEEWEVYVTGLMSESGYKRERPPDPHAPSAKLRYARYMYEVSLEDEELKKMGVFADVPLQDANYQKKVQWCNYVCFAGNRLYFYSRVPGSKGCPEEKRLSPPYH